MSEDGCAFCGRSRSGVGYLVVAEQVNICASCIELGLQVVRDGQARITEGGTELTVLPPGEGPECDLCGRTVRLSFLGFRRKLSRMTCEKRGSVMCFECLDRRGDLVNSAASNRRG